MGDYAHRPGEVENTSTGEGLDVPHRRCCLVTIQDDVDRQALFPCALLTVVCQSRLWEQGVELGDIGGGDGLEDTAKQLGVIDMLQPRHQRLLLLG